MATSIFEGSSPTGKTQRAWLDGRGLPHVTGPGDRSTAGLLETLAGAAGSDGLPWGPDGPPDAREVVRARATARAIMGLLAPLSGAALPAGKAARAAVAGIAALPSADRRQGIQAAALPAEVRQDAVLAWYAGVRARLPEATAAYVSATADRAEKTAAVKSAVSAIAAKAARDTPIDAIRLATPTTVGDAQLRAEQDAATFEAAATADAARRGAEERLLVDDAEGVGGSRPDAEERARRSANADRRAVATSALNSHA